MGFAKRHSEPETGNVQQGSRPGASNGAKGRKPHTGLSPYYREAPENMPLMALLRLVWLRLRRSWVAFRFQFRRHTWGVLRPQVSLKYAVVAGLVYFVFFYGNETEADTGIRSLSIFGGGKAVETSLEVTTPEGKPTLSKRSRQNEAAPVSAEELAGDESGQYIARYSNIAIAEMEKYGIPASISLAQGLIESRAGTSKLARSNNNHFGIKCFSRRCRKGHCSNFTDDTHKDFFRKFPNAWESWREHSKLLSSGRYAKLRKHGRDYRKWAYGLKSVGYATDRTYAEKLIGMIERYNLDRFDR